MTSKNANMAGNSDELVQAPHDHQTIIRCKTCNRTPAMVEKEKNNPTMLPYRCCKECNMPNYYVQDMDHVGIHPSSNHCILIEDCRNNEWDAVLGNA